MRPGYMQQQHNGRCFYEVQHSAASAIEELESLVLVMCVWISI